MSCCELRSTAASFSAAAGYRGDIHRSTGHAKPWGTGFLAVTGTAGLVLAGAGWCRLLLVSAGRGGAGCCGWREGRILWKQDGSGTIGTIGKRLPISSSQHPEVSHEQFQSFCKPSAPRRQAWQGAAPLPRPLPPCPPLSEHFSLEGLWEGFRPSNGLAHCCGTPHPTVEDLESMFRAGEDPYILAPLVMIPHAASPTS